jgi:ribonucleoside-diphosphate reductase beta chain
MTEQVSSTFSKATTNHLQDPLFFSENGLDLSRTEVVKYPSLLKIDDKMRSLLWVPEEIELTTDIVDMKTISAKEGRIFTETLLRATMLDSIQGRSPDICLLPICTNPELELGIISWSFTETIHSKSYSYVIKTVYADPSKIFDSLKDIPGITDCATSISLYYDALIKMNAKRELATADYSLHDHKVALFLCLTAINALEAIRFYSAFAVFFCFAENEMFLGTSKVLQMIARDESIHVGLTTKILTLLKEEDPEFAQIAKDYRKEVVAIYNDVVSQEIEWVQYIFNDGGLLGLNEEMLTEYIFYLARQKMRQFGLTDEDMTFPIMRSNPLPWMNFYLYTGKMQVAAQETEIINYKQGAIDANDSDLSDFDLSDFD